MNPKAIDFLGKKKETVLRGKAFGTQKNYVLSHEASIARRMMVNLSEGW